MAADFMSLRDKRSWRADLARIVAKFASLRDPGAVTGAARAFALPNAAAAVPSEMSGAFGPLIAGPHSNSYAPGWGNSSLHRGRAAGVANDGSVGDLKAITKSWPARSATSDNKNAPIAIIFGAGKSWIRDCGQTQSQSKRERPPAKPPTNQERTTPRFERSCSAVFTHCHPISSSTRMLLDQFRRHCQRAVSASRPTQVFGRDLVTTSGLWSSVQEMTCDILSPFTYAARASQFADEATTVQRHKL